MAFAGISCLARMAHSGTSTAPQGPWQQAESIVGAFSTPPEFAQREFSILDFGATTTLLRTQAAWISFDQQAEVQTPVVGAPDCRAAIKAAIEACHNAGGGRVTIPAGNWFCAGPITLLSNVHLHLRARAHVFFSNEPRDYAKDGAYPCGANGKLTLTRWEGNDLLNFSPLIYAYGQTNIALTGEDWTSILDGQGGVQFEGSTDCWWSWKGRSRSEFGPAAPHVPSSAPSEAQVNPRNPTNLQEAAPHLAAADAAFIQGQGQRWRRDPEFLRALSEAQVPATSRVFGIGHCLRPHMIQFIGCRNVLLEGYQVTNTPFWQHNPVNCQHVHIKRVFANSMGPNSDGFDPESCDGVLIEDCEFNTGDDCIAIDSGKGLDTQYGPAQNIVIRNSRMQSGHGALTFGSIMSGGIQNVFAYNLVFENRNWRTDPVNIAIRLKCNMNRGGYIKNLYLRDISVPNGIRSSPGMYNGLSNSPIPKNQVPTSAGAIITIDCGYDGAADNVRTRPPVVSNVHISNLKVGNVDLGHGAYSSYKALVILGPIPSDYNGKANPLPEIHPVTDVFIKDCDLGNPVNSAEPIYLYNAKAIQLENVVIGGRVHNATLSAGT